MAATITSWAQSLDYRVIYDESAGNTVTSNAGGIPVMLHSIIIDNTDGTDECFLKIADTTVATAGATEPDWMFICGSGKTATYQIPMGMPCVYGLSFWLTREEATSNQTAPAVVTNGTVKVTPLTSQL